MTSKEIAKIIWSAGFIPDKNKIRQQAKYDMRHLIASGCINYYKNIEKEKDFDEQRFLTECGLNY